MILTMIGGSILTLGEAACLLKGIETTMTAPFKVGCHIYKSHNTKKFVRWENEKKLFLNDFARLLVDEHLVKKGYKFTTCKPIDNSGLAYRYYLLDKTGFITDIELTIDIKLSHNNLVFNYETEDENIKKFLDGYFR